MKIDLYTKSVLTVIAVSLLVIAIQNVVPDAMAANTIQKVMICNDKGDCADVFKTRHGDDRGVLVFTEKFNDF